MTNDLDHLFRHHSAKIVATLTRIFGAKHLDLAEDVVQDALRVGYLRLVSTTLP
jgi:predicted RNA polymerase sigma factor